jgi:hypothetical protein
LHKFADVSEKQWSFYCTKIYLETHYFFGSLCSSNKKCIFESRGPTSVFKERFADELNNVKNIEKAKI